MKTENPNAPQFIVRIMQRGQQPVTVPVESESNAREIVAAHQKNYALSPLDNKPDPSTAAVYRLVSSTFIPPHRHRPTREMLIAERDRIQAAIDAEEIAEKDAGKLR